MNKFSKELLGVAILVTSLAIILACNSGGDLNTSQHDSSDTTDMVIYRTMTGTIAEASSSSPTNGREAIYSFSDINRIKCVDQDGNTYLASVINGSFSINLPVGYSYTVAFLSGNDFVASLYYETQGWFEMQENSDADLILGVVTIDINAQRGIPANDPWEGRYKGNVSPWEDSDSDGVPDVWWKADALSITTSLLPDGAYGADYDVDVTASGGNTPYTWTVSSGALPDGLSLDSSTGKISGIPTKKGTYSLTITLTDPRGITVSEEYSITIDDMTIVTSSTLPDAEVGILYEQQLEVYGGYAPYTWKYYSGTFIPDLTIEEDGRVTGYPGTTFSVGATKTFVVQVTDAKGATAGREFSVTLAAGRLKWDVAVGTNTIENTFSIVNGKIFVGCSSAPTTEPSFVYCLDAENGNIIWEYTTTHATVPGVAVVDNSVYFGTRHDSLIHSLNATTGTQNWEFYTTGTADSIAVSGGYVYTATSHPKTIYCLNTITGAKEWEFTSDDYSTVTVAHNQVYVGSQSGNTFCLNATTGAEIWTTADAIYDPCADANFIYGTPAPGISGFLCINKDTGAKIWNYEFTQYAIPSISAGNIYFGGRNVFHAIDATNGTNIWQVDITGSRFSNPAIAGDYVYVISDSSRLHCLKIGTGAQEWALVGPISYRTAPLLYNNNLYVAGGRLGECGLIFCLSAPESAGNSWTTFKNNAARTGSK